MEVKLKIKPFSWNDNLSEIAIESFDLIRGNLNYCLSQDIGMALAKLQILEKQGAKVDEENLEEINKEEFYYE